MLTGSLWMHLPKESESFYNNKYNLFNNLIYVYVTVYYLGWLHCRYSLISTLMWCVCCYCVSFIISKLCRYKMINRSELVFFFFFNLLSVRSITGHFFHFFLFVDIWCPEWQCLSVPCPTLWWCLLPDHLTWCHSICPPTGSPASTLRNG